MAANKPAVTIELTDEEREILEGYARRRTTAQALALRARIVLRGAESSESNTEIAAEMKLHQLTVGKVACPFLEQIDQNVPAGLDLHVALDNLQTHKTPAAHRWFLHPRFHVHFTPTYSSWLNQVER